MGEGGERERIKKRMDISTVATVPGASCSRSSLSLMSCLTSSIHQMKI